MALEIGAELVAGGYYNLGLTREQARELMFHYLGLLKEAHGADALQSIRNIAPVISEALRSVRGIRRQSDQGQSHPSFRGGPEEQGGIRRGIQPNIPGPLRSIFRRSSERHAEAVAAKLSAE